MEKYTYLVYGLEDSTLLKCQILPKVIYRFNMIQSKFKQTFCINWQNDSKSHMKMQRTYNSQNHFEILISKLIISHSNQDYVILSSRLIKKSMEQKRKSKNRLTSIWRDDFLQRCKSNSVEKDSFFNKCCWKNWIYISKKGCTYSYLAPSIKINSKLITDLNIKPKTTKLLLENILENLCNPGLYKFLRYTTKRKIPETTNW